MATRIQQIVSITLNAGAQGSVAHSLNIRGTPVIPDLIRRDNMGFAGISANATSVTVKNDTGAPATVQLYLRYYHTQDRVYGNAAVHQMTPAPFWVGGAASMVAPASVAVPQPLRNANWNTGNHALELDNDLVFATFLGYAWRNFAIGDVFECAWASTNAGTKLDWGEIAIGTGVYIAGSAPTITPVDFTSVKTPLGAAGANQTTPITLTSGIAVGSGLWMIIGAHHTAGTAPKIEGDDIDVQASGLLSSNVTPGWQPSLNLGVPTAFAIDDTNYLPQASWSTSTGF